MLVMPIAASELVDALPLISAYQRFYEVEPDDDRNAVFFRRFTESDDDGMLLGARDEGGVLVGYVCLHWRLDTVVAREVVCLHDLFVVPAVRGTGAGRALLEAAADVAATVVPRRWCGAPPPTTAPPSASTTRRARRARPGSSTSSRPDQACARLEMVASRSGGRVSRPSTWRPSARGTSGLHRARCWITPSRGDPQESATENRPPMAGPAPWRGLRTGKGETVR